MATYSFHGLVLATSAIQALGRSSGWLRSRFVAYLNSCGSLKAARKKEPIYWGFTWSTPPTSHSWLIVGPFYTQFLNQFQSERGWFSSFCVKNRHLLFVFGIKFEFINFILF